MNLTFVANMDLKQLRDAEAKALRDIEALKGFPRHVQYATSNAHEARLLQIRRRIAYILSLETVDA